MLKCDLHGLKFQDARCKIIKSLRRCFNMGETLLQIIHGYHGHILKDYIESYEFLKDMEEEGFYLINTTSSTKLRKNPGESIFEIGLQIPKRKPKQKKMKISTEHVFNLMGKGKKFNILDLQALF